MLPFSHLTIIGHEMQGDAKGFLNSVLLTLLNMLTKRGLNSKSVDFMGQSDSYIFRGDPVTIMSLSRSTFLPSPRISEISLVEHVSTDDQAKLNLTSADLLKWPDWDSILTNNYRCVSPVSVIFPTSYLTLNGAEATTAHEAVAEKLLADAESDVDRKARIVRINPIFVGRDFTIDPKLCFVLMEFKSPYVEIYDSLIKPAVEAEGLTCMKSDDIFSTTAVIEDIWANINRAVLILAEISSNNPNVMYELGICHTIGKDVMMITQNPKDLPFNFRHMRCYPYTNDIPGSEDLKKNIKSVIQHVKTTMRH